VKGRGKQEKEGERRRKKGKKGMKKKKEGEKGREGARKRASVCCMQRIG
jgi:hypothetical protein